MLPCFRACRPATFLGQVPGLGGGASSPTSAPTSSPSEPETLGQCLPPARAGGRRSGRGPTPRPGSGISTHQQPVGGEGLAARRAGRDRGAAPLKETKAAGPPWWSLAGSGD